MKKWCTDITAICPKTGQLKKWCGDTIEAPTAELAQEWCDNNKGYLKVNGELVAEIPCYEGTIIPNFSKMIDYENQQLN